MTRTTNASADRAERRAARLDDPRFENLRRRPVRRRLVLGLTALLVVEAVAFLAFDVAAPGTWQVFAVLGVLVAVVAAFVLLLGMLKASTRGVEELPPAVLDEREQQVKGVVYARAYGIGVSALFGLLMAVGLWGLLDLTVTTGLVTAVVVVTFHVALVLPTLVAAWLAD